MGKQKNISIYSFYIIKKGEYTILIIAHRFSTVLNSDKIMFLDNGKIIAEGTHENLLKNNK